ncbi:hypothetical protein QBC35DRAFT_529400 [Podospora australis]|uniref:Uncharacterized protein n=1 Tax=Podospora australis TaxID=1536484 RepID=A0AAN7AJK6_9PEZI|nr:hypothetical protein QBC35DRAFT_529400 [Podospora australis]
MPAWTSAASNTRHPQHNESSYPRPPPHDGPGPYRTAPANSQPRGYNSDNRNVSGGAGGFLGESQAGPTSPPVPNPTKNTASSHDTNQPEEPPPGTQPPLRIIHWAQGRGSPPRFPYYPTTTTEASPYTGGVSDFSDQPCPYCNRHTNEGTQQQPNNFATFSTPREDGPAPKTKRGYASSTTSFSTTSTGSYEPSLDDYTISGESSTARTRNKHPNRKRALEWRPSKTL